MKSSLQIEFQKYDFWKLQDYSDFPPALFLACETSSREVVNSIFNKLFGMTQSRFEPATKCIRGVGNHYNIETGEGLLK